MKQSAAIDPNVCTTLAFRNVDLFTLRLGIEISADEITPLAFSRCKRWQVARYGLFVEIVGDSLAYTVRKHTRHGYTLILEQTTDFLTAYELMWPDWTNG